MKKRIWKKLVALGLAVTLFLSYGNITTLAASSVRGNIDGTTVSGSITTYNNSYAVAETSYARSSSKIYATAYIYYWWGSTYYYTTSGRASSTAGGVSATATKKLGGAEVVAAEGNHEVQWGAYTWLPSPTTVGTIPSSAIEI